MNILEVYTQHTEQGSFVHAQSVCPYRVSSPSVQCTANFQLYHIQLLQTLDKIVLCQFPQENYRLHCYQRKMPWSSCYASIIYRRAEKVDNGRGKEKREKDNNKNDKTIYLLKLLMYTAYRKEKEKTYNKKAREMHAGSGWCKQYQERTGGGGDAC